MKRTWIIFPLVMLIVSLLLPSGAGAQSGDPEPDDLIAAVNELRAENDLDPYRVDPTLMIIAQQQAEYMASTGVVTHYGEDGSRPYQRAVKAGYQVAGDLTFGGFFSENIASGNGTTIEDVVSDWQGAQADQKTMLSHDFDDIGVGIASENGITYYVLDAGKSSG